MFEKTFSFWRRLVGQAPAPSASAQQDRRLWVRYAADLRGNVQLADAAAGETTLAHVRDLSLGGANLEVERPPQLGQMLTLELAGGQDEILACVVRVTAQGEGKWSLGCVFSRELTNDELMRFGAHKIQAADADKRTWLRYPTDLQAAFRKVGDPASLPHPAKVLNISASGIGLTVNPALNAGALLNVDLRDRTGRTVSTILACVVHTSACAGGDFAVGCNFIRELREDELEALL
jgi:head-tail adaptor